MDVDLARGTVTHLGGVIRPDGKQMALATDEGVQLWDLDPDTWRDAASITQSVPCVSTR